MVLNTEVGNIESQRHSQGKIIYDPLYGFIHLTPLEWKVVQTPFFQRLRWIKQLGFSSYVFPSAEHSRFGHSIGAMHNADKILASIGKAVSFDKLCQNEIKDEAAIFHRDVRLGALLHDIGSFAFSHTIEEAYIKFDSSQKGLKREKAHHETLGAKIILNSEMEGGLTKLFKESHVDPKKIASLVKGDSSSLLANQILHSEIDCDRMDYLLRDAYFTGLKYGSYDRDYLIYHMMTQKVGNEEVLTINVNALQSVEDFLTSRFNWYSQVIRSPRGAKYDALAERIAYMLLEQNLLITFDELLDQVENSPEKFYGFNDQYYMTTLHRLYTEGKLKHLPVLENMVSCLLFTRGIESLEVEGFEHRLLEQNDENNIKKWIKKSESKATEVKQNLTEIGGPSDWVIVDYPKKSIALIKSSQKVKKDGELLNVFHSRDAAKILDRDGRVRLLADFENSTISKLSNIANFTPNLFCSAGFYKKYMDKQN